MTQPSSGRQRLSIITPVYAEEATVEACALKVREIMTAELAHYDYEHIFADNSSPDDTVATLRRLAASDPRIKVILNSRNVGPFRSAANAMRSATGAAIVPMLAADLQDPPEVIPRLVAQWEAGSLIVWGIRTNRNEGLFLRASRGLFYRIQSWSGDGTTAPPHGGEFQLIDRRVADSILSIDDQYPYIRGLVAQTGARSTTVPYTWVPRSAGKSKNSFWALADQASNGFVTTARAPSRLALMLGLLVSVVGIVFGLVSLVWLSITRNGAAAGIPALIVGVFVLGGLQLFFIGLLGEYVLSIHGQVRRPPRMFEVERINLDTEPSDENRPMA